MDATWMTALALVLVTAAGYAQHRIGAHTAGRARIAATRLLLAAVGVGLGVTTAAILHDDTRLAVLSFLIGFGIVHVPAAVILFFKSRRGEGKS